MSCSVYGINGIILSAVNRRTFHFTRLIMTVSIFPMYHSSNRVYAKTAKCVQRFQECSYKCICKLYCTLECITVIELMCVWFKWIEAKVQKVKCTFNNEAIHECCYIFKKWRKHKKLQVFVVEDCLRISKCGLVMEYFQLSFSFIV